MQWETLLEHVVIIRYTNTDVVVIGSRKHVTGKRGTADSATLEIRKVFKCGGDPRYLHILALLFTVMTVLRNIRQT